MLNPTNSKNTIPVNSEKEYKKEYDGLLNQAESTIFYEPKKHIIFNRVIFKDLVINEKEFAGIDDAGDGQKLKKSLLIYNGLNDRLNNTIKLLQNAGLNAVIISDDESVCESILIHNARRNLYSQDKFYSFQDIFIVVKNKDEKITKDWIKSTTKETSIKSFIEKNKANLVQYRKDYKPVKDKIYDSILYVDSWSYLSREERLLRVVTTAMLPFIVLPLYLIKEKEIEENFDKAKKINLSVWQYRKYKKKPSFNDIVYNGQHMLNEKVILMIREQIKVLGFINNKGETTKSGKLVNKKDNVLFIAGNNELTKKQLLIRSVLLIGLSLIIGARLFSLVCRDNRSTYGLAISYVALSTVVLTACFAIFDLKYNHKLAVGTFLLGLTLCIALCELVYPQSKITSGISIALICTAAIMFCVQFAVHTYYKKDREFAESLGISTSSYLTIKKLVEGGYINTVKFINDIVSFETTEDRKVATIQAIKDNIYGEKLKSDFQVIFSKIQEEKKIQKELAGKTKGISVDSEPRTNLQNCAEQSVKQTEIRTR